MGFIPIRAGLPRRLGGFKMFVLALEALMTAEIVSPTRIVVILRHGTTPPAGVLRIRLLNVARWSFAPLKRTGRPLIPVKTASLVTTVAITVRRALAIGHHVIGGALV